MRRCIPLVLLSVSGFNGLPAQSGPPTSGVTESRADQNARRLEAELFERSAENGSAQAAKEVAGKRDVELRRQMFVDKANKFVTLWITFAKELNDRQTFNAKLAKKVSKAFRDMETSEGWPVETMK